ncbi:MAG: hypothetical protein GKR77_03875 [Legionellales bacterium]|nr:hypothetical protein [Legionellales bacterium]
MPYQSTPITKTHTPEESLKGLLQAMCNVSIDTLRFTDDGLVDVYIDDEQQRAVFERQFTMLFNFPQLFDKKISDYVKHTDEKTDEKNVETKVKPYMHDRALSQYAPCYSEAPTVKGAVRFLKSLIPPEDHPSLSELESHLGETGSQDQEGQLISSWKDEKGQQQNRKAALEASLARIGNYFSYISLQRIQDCRQSGRPLPLRQVSHLVVEKDDPLPIAKSQTPFLTSDGFHRIFKIEYSIENQYRLIVDIQRLYDLIEPLRIATKGRYNQFSRRAFARRFGHFLEPHGGVVTVDDKPIFAEDYQRSKTTIVEQKPGRVHFLLDYSLSMKYKAKRLTAQIKILCADLLKKNIDVDITYFYNDETEQLSLSSSQNMTLVDQLPLNGVGNTPLYEALNLVLKKTAPNDQLIVFTDGDPSTQGEITFSSTAPPQCALFGLGNITELWFDEVTTKWGEQADYHDKEISFGYKVFNSRTDIEILTQGMQETIVSFTKTGEHRVTLGHDLFSIPQGAGPIQFHHQLSSSSAKPQDEKSQSEVPLLCSPNHFFANPKTHYNLGGGDTRVSKQLSSTFSDYKKETHFQWLKQYWNELDKNLAFIEKAKQLLAAYSEESFFLQKPPSFVRSYTSIPNVTQLMKQLMKETASSDTDPVYSTQSFLRERYFESAALEMDVPSPTIVVAPEAKHASKVTPSEVTTPLLPNNAAANNSSPVIMPLSTLIINSRINHRLKKVDQKWKQLTSENPDAKQPSSDSSSEPLPIHIQQLVNHFTTNLGFFVHLSIWLAGYRQSYQQAKEIVHRPSDNKKMVETLSSLLFNVGRSSYLHVVIMFLRVQVLTPQQRSSHLTEAELPTDFQLYPSQSTPCCG